MTKCITGDNIISALALVAQLDRVLDYESRGQGFESLLAHQIKKSIVRYSFLFYVSSRTRTREGFSVKKTVRWTVFRKKSLSDSESQLALAESKGGESLLAHQIKKSIVRYSFLFYVSSRTRTREGFSVKKTVPWTVFRKKSLSDSESQLALAESKGGESTTHTASCVPLHKFH